MIQIAVITDTNLRTGEMFEPEDSTPRPVSNALVREVVKECGLSNPNIHPFVRSMVNDNVSDNTKRQRVGQLARAMMTVAGPLGSDGDVAKLYQFPFHELDEQSVMLLRDGIAQHGTTYSSRNTMKDAVRSVLRQGWLAGNFNLDTLERMKTILKSEDAPRDDSRQTRRYIEQGTIETVFAGLTADGTPRAIRDAALLAVLFGTGLRKSEPTGITLGQLDLSRDKITQVRCKGDVIRDIYLPAGARRWLIKLAEIRTDEQTDDSPLIPGSVSGRGTGLTDKPMTSGAIGDVVKRLFPNNSAHDCRRTFLSNLLLQGVDLATTARIAGHSNPSITMTYDVRSEQTVQVSVEKVVIPFSG